MIRSAISAGLAPAFAYASASAVIATTNATDVATNLVTTTVSTIITNDNVSAVDITNPDITAKVIVSIANTTFHLTIDTFYFYHHYFFHYYFTPAISITSTDVICNTTITTITVSTNARNICLHNDNFLTTLLLPLLILILLINIYDYVTAGRSFFFLQVGASLG